MPAPSASAGTGTVSFSGGLSHRRRQSARRRCRAGRGELARGRKRQKSACVPRSALAKAGALSVPPSAAAGAGCGQPPGGAERQPPALPAQAQHSCASPQRVGEPTRPAVCPGGPPQSPVCRSFRHLRTFPSSADRLPGGWAARKGGCEGVLVGYDEGEAHRGRADGREVAHAGAARRETLHLLAGCPPSLDVLAAPPMLVASSGAPLGVSRKFLPLISLDPSPTAPSPLRFMVSIRAPRTNSCPKT
eukprot:COSAG04_NODE_9027_length_906_cov_1.102850_1_plen_246_part_01